jgi:hypothetical protein
MSDPARVTDPGPAKVSRNFFRLLALLPPIFLIGLVVRYAVQVPFLDQWELVPLLDRSFSGDLTIHDLWAQHNEHRIFFPRLIMLGLARLTGWNIGYELAVNIVLAAAIFAVLTVQIRRTARELALPELHRAIPACSLVVFSISQFQNWLWGWQLQMLLNLLASVAGLLLLAARPFNWLKFAGSATLGIVATYSFANGLLFWPIGLLVLLAVTSGRKERSRTVALWIVTSVLAAWFYFRHYEKPAAHPSLLSIFQDPLEYANYVFDYLGATCAEYRIGQHTGIVGLALICGYGGAAAFVWAGWRARRIGLVNGYELLPYLGLSLYSVGGALMTGIGRVGFGRDQALSSRYCTMTVPFWVSLIVLLFILASRKNGAANVSTENISEETIRQNRARAVSRLTLGATIILLGLGSIMAIGAMKALSERQERGRQRLIQLASHPEAQADYQDLLGIYPTIQVVLDRYPILEKHRLATFKDVQR